MISRIPRMLSVAVLCGCMFLFQNAYGQTDVTAEQEVPADGPKVVLSVDKDLSFLLGKWHTKLKIFPNELLGNKEELKGKGTAEYKAFGRVIEGIRVSDTNRGHHEDREFIWYDQNSKSYNIIVVNSEGHSATKKMTKSGEHFVVEFTGSTGHGEGDKTGQESKVFTVRAKYKLQPDGEVKYYSEVKIGKADYVPFIQLKMTRNAE